MRAVFIPHVRGELIHQTSTLEGLTQTQESSHCQTAAERLLDTGRLEYLEGASLGWVLWNTQTGDCSEVLLGPRQGQTIELRMHQVKFGPCSDWLCRRGYEGLNAAAMMSKTPSGSAPHSFCAIRWALMANSIIQCQETFCAKLLCAYKYLVQGNISSFKLTGRMWKFP